MDMIDCSLVDALSHLGPCYASVILLNDTAALRDIIDVLKTHNFQIHRAKDGREIFEINDEYCVIAHKKETPCEP